MDGEQVYNLHFTRVYRYFHYRDLSSQDSEDLCHEVFLRFYKKYLPEELDSEACIKILYRISSFVLKEHYKQPVAYQLNEDNDPADEAVILSLEEFSDSEQEWEIRIENLRLELHSAIGELGEAVGSVITLRFLEGKTRKETAEALGLSEDTVHTYQKRGVASLRKKLTDGTTVPLSPYTE